MGSIESGTSVDSTLPSLSKVKRPQRYLKPSISKKSMSSIPSNQTITTVSPASSFTKKTSFFSLDNFSFRYTNKTNVQDEIVFEEAQSEFATSHNESGKTKESSKGKDSTKFFFPKAPKYKHARRERVQTARMKLMRSLYETEGNDNYKWPNRINFLFAALGGNIGIYNFLLFPSLVSINNRGTFIIAYFICYVTLGIPLMVMELSLGQFTSKGPSCCYQFAPLFKGVGFANALLSLIWVWLFNLTMAWLVYYFFHSIYDGMSSIKCDNKWNTDICLEDFVEKPCIEKLTQHTDGTCRNQANITVNIYNYTLANQHNIRLAFPAQQYFYNQLLGYSIDNDPSQLGSIKNQYLIVCIALPLVLTWVCLVNWKNTYCITSSILFLFKPILISVFVIDAFILDEAATYESIFAIDELHNLFDLHTWIVACTQMLFSGSLFHGIAQTLASYNTFSNDVVGDAVILCLGDFVASVGCAVIMFEYMSIFARSTGSTLNAILKTWQGIDMAFVVFPMALNLHASSQAYFFIYMLFIFIMGIDTEVVCVKTIVMTVLDLMDDHPRYVQKVIILTICLVVFFLELPMCTEGGITLWKLVSEHTGAINIFSVGLLEVVAVSYVYRSGCLISDIEFMVGRNVFFGRGDWKIIKPWLMSFWLLFTPVTLILLLIAVVVIFIKKHRDREHPIYYYEYSVIPLNVIGVCTIIGTMVVLICSAKGRLKERLFLLLSPGKWRPMELEDAVLYKNHINEQFEK